MAFTCPRCGRTSHNPNDAAQNYCSNCRVFLDDEATVVKAMAEELSRKTANMELVLRPASVFQLTALVQLACRHPAVSDPMRETATRFLVGVREYFADCPVVLDVVRRGDDPAEDR
jgi:hypothetical protein